MNIIHITNEKESFTITDTTPVCFVITNQNFTGSFILSEPGAHALVLGLFTDQGNFSIHIDQRHEAPDTTSEVILRSLVDKEQEFFYQGNIHIKKSAQKSIASQEARGLLLAPGAKWKAIPSLEILPNDVICKHKATASPLSPESLYYLHGRGLAPKEAKQLLQEAFILSALENTSLTVAPAEREAILSLIQKILTRL